MLQQQKYCEKCGLDYHGLAAAYCKNESPPIGSTQWRQGRWQLMENIYLKQGKLRREIINIHGVEELKRRQQFSEELLNIATYQLTEGEEARDIEEPIHAHGQKCLLAYIKNFGAASASSLQTMIAEKNRIVAQYRAVFTEDKTISGGEIRDRLFAAWNKLWLPHL